MLALINTLAYEEVMEDLNNQIFNCIGPKSMAKIVWIEVEEMAAEGSTEEFLYNYVKEEIEAYQVIDNLFGDGSQFDDR